jgi:hypothetical protein
VRPRRPWLTVNLSRDFGNRIDVQHAILAPLFNNLRSKGAQALTVDAAVDDHVRDMDAWVRILAPCSVRSCADRPWPPRSDRSPACRAGLPRRR